MEAAVGVLAAVLQSGSGSAPAGTNGTSSLSTGDEYDFFRSFVAGQAARDPEIAKLLALNQPPQLNHKQLLLLPQSSTSDSSNGTGTIKAVHGQQPSTEISFETGLQANASRLLHSGADSADIVVQGVTAADEHSAQEECQAGLKQLARPPLVSHSTAVPAASRIRPDFTRRQIKSLRNLFPIQSPAVRLAALQGEYQLLDLVGRGAFGAAYKARHLASGALVCIKTVEGSSRQQGQEALEQQKKEVAVLAALQHPNIIRYRDCFCEGNKLHIVMEWADGGDLQGLIQQLAKAGSHMPEDQLLAYFVQLVAALAHIHGAGVMHRDLKTSNIFLTSQGLLKLGDFGIAKVLGAHSNTGSKSGSSGGSLYGSTGAPAAAVASSASGPMAQSFVGTPNYLAPEQLGCGPYNQKADIWACGCVLYEMAALRPAFKADLIPKIYRLIKRGRTAPLPTCYSAGLRALQQRLMASDPWTRPSSMELLQHELLKPHLDSYRQMLQQLGLQLPQPVTPASSSSGTATNVSSLAGASYSFTVKDSVALQTSTTQAAQHAMEFSNAGQNRMSCDGAVSAAMQVGQRCEPCLAQEAAQGSVQGLPPDHVQSLQGQIGKLPTMYVTDKLSILGTTAVKTSGRICNSGNGRALAKVEDKQQQQPKVAYPPTENIDSARFRLEQLQQQRHLLAAHELETAHHHKRQRMLTTLCTHVLRLVRCSHCQSRTSLDDMNSQSQLSGAAQQTTTFPHDEACGQTTTAACVAGVSSSNQPDAQDESRDLLSLELPSQSQFDESRLLPPLRQTLSTVPSSNVSSAFSSIAGAIKAGSITAASNHSTCGNRGEGSVHSTASRADGSVHGTNNTTDSVEVGAVGRCASGAASTGKHANSSGSEHEASCVAGRNTSLVQLEQLGAESSNLGTISDPCDIVGVSLRATSMQQPFKVDSTVQACMAYVESHDCPDSVANVTLIKGRRTCEASVVAGVCSALRTTAAVVLPQTISKDATAGTTTEATAARSETDAVVLMHNCNDDAAQHRHLRQCQPGALQQEQLAVQSALRKLRTQLCYTASRSAAASPWGSCDSVCSSGTCAVRCSENK